MQAPPTDQRLKLPKLLEYRAAQAVRRAEAFCDAPEFVQGIEVQPLTPATFSMLLAIQSPFVCGGREPNEADVRNYLWFHSPLYAHCGVANWPERKKKALAKLVRLLCPTWRRVLGLPPQDLPYLTALFRVSNDIRKLVDAAFADAGSRSSRPSQPVATTEAFFIHTMASAYGWPPERTRQTPIRQLSQLVRCIRASQGDDIGDDGEDQILAEHLMSRRIEALKEKVKEATPHV